MSFASELQSKHESANSNGNGNGNGASKSVAHAIDLSSFDEPEIVSVAPVKAEKVSIKSLDAFPALGGSSSGKTSPGPASAWVQPVRSPAPRAIPVAARSNVVTEAFSLDDSAQRKTINKQVLSQTLQKIKNSTNTSIECSTSRLNQARNFLVKGHPEDVYRARRELIRQLSKPVTLTFTIPASVRSHVIGSQGNVLRPIIEKSQTKIEIARRENNSIPADDDEMLEVSVEGDAEGANIAKSDILAIVNERMKEMKTRISNVNPLYYPIVNKLLSSSSKKDIDVLVPDIFVSDDDRKLALNSPIVISGDRPQVLETRSFIESLIPKIESNYVKESVTIPDRLHRFVIGVDHSFEKEIFLKTNSIIIEKLNDTLEGSNKQPGSIVFLSKSQKDAIEATKIAKAKAKSITMEILDISRAHGRSIPHAQALSQFLESNEDRFIKPLLTDDISIKFPNFDVLYKANTNEVVFEITGSNKDQIKQFRKKIVELVNKFPPSVVIRASGIDPFFFKHLTTTDSSLFLTAKKNGVAVILPKDVKINSDIILVYDSELDTDADEDFGPTPEEITNKLTTVDESFNELREKKNSLSEIKIENLDSTEIGYIYGKNNSTLKSILKNTKNNDVDININEKDGSVLIKGLKSEVSKVKKDIEDVIAEGKEFAVLSSYTTELDFPKTVINRLIGKGGSNLASLRDEFGVQIDVDEEGHVIVKGVKRTADEAKHRIINLGKRWADEVLLRIPIPHKYHQTMIGKGGKFVKRLEEKYDVHIRFPREDSSNVGGNNTENPKSLDEVVVRGPSKGSNKVKEELTELLKFEVENGNVKVLHVPTKSLARIIGKQGENINNIKDSTGTSIQVEQKEDNENDEGKENDFDQSTIEITGTKSGIKEAESKIMAIVKEIQDFTSEFIEVDPKHYGAIVGKEGSTMREIIVNAGGPEDSHEQRRYIQIPNQSLKSNKIEVSGNKKVVAKIIKAIEALVADRDLTKSITVDVPKARHRLIIGSGGMVRRSLQDEFHVTVDVPKQDDSSTSVKISGHEENLEKAKEKILELTKDVWNHTIEVPKAYQEKLIDRGALFRRLRNDFSVSIDSGSKRGDRGRGKKSETPEPEVPESAIGPDSKVIQWTTAAEASESATEKVTWKLRGDDVDVKEAIKYLNEKIAELSTSKYFGYLWLKNSSQFKLIIGPQGETINHIRRLSKCQINVPRPGGNNVIVVQGSEKGIEIAREEIIKAIKN